VENFPTVENFLTSARYIEAGAFYTSLYEKSAAFILFPAQRSIKLVIV
jgi:hypothetical protein